ncbi:hypothetical protein HDF19_15130 [Mucilaginibacter sp. E4BP6]|uniref:hypothetical protein n=1 Tax=Mucilaginibacter sp. E4BP6 TaxID=2723089 RepID=UPI0015CCDBA1|nr:hypothetical protein [Mucilaginibacter sp. E4BP6]NYE65673.1 hypothetical protein [Mucilaginibacter sp. E4BP6]
MSILITSANSAAAYQLKSKLNADQVILGDYEELPALMLKSGAMIQLPNPKSVSYSHQMLTLCLDKGIQTVYPLREEEAILLKESDQLFKEYDINIVYQ